MKTIVKKNVQVQEILRYSKSEVNNAPLLNVFIRGSQTKGLINMCRNTLCFFMHGCKLYHWKVSLDREEILRRRVDEQAYELRFEDED